MKKIRSISIVLLGVLLLTVCLSGCGKSNTTNDSEEKNGNVSEDASMSMDEATDEFQSLFETAIKYVEKGDKNSFSKLYKNADEFSEVIDSDYASLAEYVEGEYTDTSYNVIVGDGIYYGGFVMGSITSGIYPNVRTMSATYLCSFSFENGKCLFDFSKEAIAVTNEAILDIYPSEFREAYNAGRNATVFGGKNGGADYSWVGEKMTIPGSLSSNVYLAWQNEDGSVSFMLNTKNGTDEIRAVMGTEVTMKDQSLGEIFVTTCEGENIAPKKASNGIFTVPASEVKTGTQPWTSVQVDTNQRAD